MKKKILIVDDSALMRSVLCDIIKSDQRFEVEDTAKDWIEAFELLSKKTYSAVILDINMPRMNGLQLLRKMKKTNIRANVLMASTLTKEGAKETIEALELGALDFIHKPDAILEIKGNEFKREFLKLLGVVTRPNVGIIRDTLQLVKKKPVRGENSFTPKLRVGVKVSGKKLVAIASSTGGPKALQEVVTKLPSDLNAPVLIVQHMPKGFTKSLAERLDGLSSISIKEAEEGEKIKIGQVYIAPGGKHMKLKKRGSDYCIQCTDEPPREGVKPCANYMYESLTDSSFAEIVCVVLTGMGGDGTKGILHLEEKKKIHVIAQNEETCAVYGMPKSIVATGLVNDLVPLGKVAEMIIKNVGVQ